MIYGRLKYSKSSSGRTELRRSTCNESLHSSTEEDDRGGRWHLLVCPTCSVGFGKWPSVFALENELEALSDTR